MAVELSRIAEGAGDDESRPLSAAQLDVWRAQQLAPDDALFNLGGYLEIFGAVDYEPFDAAIREALEEVDSHRVRFVDTAQGPRQVIGALRQFEVPLIDFSHDADPCAAALSWTRAATAKPYDLQRSPLFRFALIKITDDRFWWFCGMHHLVIDLFGIVLFLRRVAGLYASRIDGTTCPWPERMSWLEFLEDEERYRSSARHERDRRHWLDHLRDRPDPVTLSGKSPRWPEAVITVDGSIPRSVVDALEKLAAEHDASAVAAFLAVTAAYLFRISGSSDIVLGMPVAARSGSNLRHVIGFLANVVPVRLYVDPRASFGTLLRHAGTRTRDAFRHQRYPLGELRGDLGLTSGQPNIFGTVVNFVPNDVQFDMAGQPVRMNLFINEGRVEDLAITLHVRAATDIAVRFTGHAANYDASALRRHLQQFLQLIQSAVAHAEQATALLPILGKSELAYVRNEWVGTAALTRETLPRLFERQAERTPDAVAFVSGSQSFTYLQVNVRANRLAHRLIARGVGPDHVVGLCTERSAELLIGMLAILKAGGAYVPLDPAYPVRRLQQMLGDVKPTLLLRAASSAWTANGISGLGLLEGVEQWVLGTAESDEPGSSDVNPRVDLNPRHPAYVIYTSGSSGTPKGVMVTHAGIGAMAMAHVEQLDIGGRSRVLQYASLNFDVALAEVAMALCGGATLVLTPPDALSGAALRGVLAAQRITHVMLTPSVLRTFQPGEDLALQYLVVGGERCPPALIAEWSRVCRVVNAYGPTESTVCATLSAPLQGIAPTPLGPPIAGSQVFVLDAALEPVPADVVGELYIAGIGLARGYLDRPGLTAERFVANPYGPAGSRMYRSGDLVRRREGYLEYVGRTDAQVKIRGVRIETGEIEAVLCDEPGVEQAVVIAREDAFGCNYLVAYVTGDSHRTDPSTLRQALDGRLPEYMIPRTIIPLATLPLTPTGKLDRLALPESEHDGRVAAAYEPPQGPVEAALARIWAEVLQLERVGRHDNFFELGGNSLLLVDLVEKVRQCGWHAEARTVFGQPSVAGLALAIASSDGALPVPPNRIAADSARITPDLLPLLKLEQAHIDAIVARIPGGTANVQDIYPLVPLQEGILVHHRLSQDTDAYVLGVLLAADRAESIEILAAALQAVVDRHDVLRTAILWEGLPEPVQVVLRKATLTIEEFPRSDVSALEDLWRCRHARLDVSTAPLMRLHRAYDAAQGRWLLLLQCHHLIGDHTTLEQIIDEVRKYPDGIEHLSTPVPFRNFAAQALSAVAPDFHEAYFRRNLGDIDEPTAPFGLLDVRGDGAGVDEARLPLEAGLARELREQARRLGVTASSLFHLAWALVLARLSARDDVVFGTVLLGRMHGARGIDRALGLFINTLPLRLQLGDACVADAVRKTHQQLGELLRHEHASLALAQKCSSLPAATPLFSSVLNYRHDRNGMVTSDVEVAPGITLLRAEERTNYPLGISVDEGHGFSLTAQAPAWVDSRRICRFLHTVLTGIVDALKHAPDTRLHNLQVLCADERERLLRDWSGAGRPAAAATIPQLFEAQAARTPDAIAVSCETYVLTYTELNGAANRLAHLLIENGVGPERLVGVCVDRSVSMLVAILGILKAGGAYVPVDLTHPAQRSRRMLEDARPVLVLYSSAATTTWCDRERDGEGLPQGIDARVFDLRGGLAGVEGTNESNPRNADRLATLDIAHPAYVIHTSGSSGLPKSVVVTHAGVSALAVAHREALQVTVGSRLLQYASLNFDVSVAEIVTAWCSGATLILASAQALSGDALRALLVGQRISHLMLPPAVLATIHSGTDLALQCLVVGGENCPPSLIAAWSGAVRLLNAYGPTENTVCATLSAPLAGAPAPLGRPLPGTRLYVLDNRLEPVPIGVQGDLYISGAGLARGYLNRPALTAERFVADPYGEPGSRMYRSGDLARWLVNGLLEYVGRADTQVKIRGFRIELGEIETALSDLDGVAAAAVTVGDGPRGRYLLAYIVNRDGEIDPKGLRQALSTRLPEYMLPTVFIPLAALPRLPNGKLDRRALPPPGKAPRPSTSREPPQTPTEMRLAAIWTDILHVENLDRSDDFFELGGHSLTAVQAVSRIRDAFALELSLKTLFDARSLQALATEIDEGLRATQRTPSTAPLVIPGNEPAPLSYSQERMWLIQTLNPRNTAYNMAANLLIRGSVHHDALAAGIDDLFRRHQILRTRIVVTNEQPCQVVDAWSAGKLNLIDLRAEPDAMAAALRLAAAETRTPFDLNHDPVIRVRLFRVDRDVHLLTLVLHHIAGDQWSMGILGRELATLYNARRRGLEARLETLPIEYRDYAVWQRSGTFAGQFERQLSFWQRQLIDLPTVDLPTDRTRPKAWTLQGAFYSRQIPAELYFALEHFGQKAGCTLFMTMFAGFVALIRRIAGQDDIPIGVPVANRTQSAIEGLVGTFVNTVILRNDLSGEPNFHDLLKRVRSTALDAFARQDVSFDRLVQELGQRRDISRAPLVQVLFNMTNAPMRGLEFDELAWEPVELDRGGAQFELSFSVDPEVTRKLSVEYNTDLFDRATIERLVGQYFTLLEAAVAAPDRRISALALLPFEERATLSAWNATSASYPPTVFPQMFEAQVARAPHAAAISFEGDFLTYTELNDRANRLAGVLRQRGIRAGSVVAVCARRTSQLVVDLLAVQKSGGTYVPLDPDFPLDRLNYMLADSRAELLLVEAGAPELDLPAGVHVLEGLPAMARAVAVSERNLEPPASHDVAYVIYTSGSTGRPKGVAVSHGAVANFLSSMRDRPGLTASDVLAAVTTISFDIAGLELYLPLLVGARIEFVSRRAAADGPALAGLLASSGATVLQATPATWRLLLETDWAGGPGFRAFCGGEPLSRSLADALLERVGSLWNLYGPTETTIWSALEEVHRGASPIGIGRPIANTQIHILDAAGERMPIGVAGEICIGGAGVARGYHRRPSLTADRFVPDPFSPLTGARLYRTGDLGRWAADGTLQHLGRLDTQVKIRGFRIELGEIEALLNAHDSIRQAVVTVREARADDPRLVAYLVYREGEDLATGDIKAYLRQHLPDYMVPAIAVTLPTLPLTANGKIDRSALPDPFAAPLQAVQGRDLPESRMESLLADIWRHILKVDRIAADDNFFELGGYSLLSLRVAKLVEKRIGYRMDPRSLFFHNLREVAALLEKETSIAEEMSR